MNNPFVQRFNMKNTQKLGRHCVHLYRIFTIQIDYWARNMVICHELVKIRTVMLFCYCAPDMFNRIHQGSHLKYWQWLGKLYQTFGIWFDLQRSMRSFFFVKCDTSCSLDDEIGCISFIVSIYVSLFQEDVKRFKWFTGISFEENQVWLLFSDRKAVDVHPVDSLVIFVHPRSIWLCLTWPLNLEYHRRLVP